MSWKCSTVIVPFLVNAVVTCRDMVTRMSIANIDTVEPAKICTPKMVENQVGSRDISPVERGERERQREEDGRDRGKALRLAEVSVRILGLLS